MTPGSSVPYMSTSQEVKSPFLSDLKPSVSSLHPSPPGECHLLSGPQWPAGNVGDGGPVPLSSTRRSLCVSFKVWIFSLETHPCTQNFVYY